MKLWLINALLLALPSVSAASVAEAFVPAPAGSVAADSVVNDSAAADSVVNDSAAADSVVNDSAAADSVVNDSAAADSVVPAAQRPSFYERNTQRRRTIWQKLTPNQGTIHFYGGVGLVSIGTGWHYGRRDQWESELLVGYVPRYDSDRPKWTLTLKQRFVPWYVSLGSRWGIEPLTCGLFVNLIFGEDFWTNEPSRYPDNRYYGFPTKLRTHIFLGQRLRYSFARRDRFLWKSVSAYYELSTNDLYLASSIPNRKVRLRDILVLAFGLRLEVF